jgi:hypothetical protein
MRWSATQGPGLTERTRQALTDATVATLPMLLIASRARPDRTHVHGNYRDSRSSAMSPYNGWPCRAGQFHDGRPPFGLVIADPPNSDADAEKYGVVMVDRGRVTRALATVVRPGGFLCWLDCVWPMHRKAEWLTVGRILLQRSTNHRVTDRTAFFTSELPRSPWCRLGKRARRVTAAYRRAVEAL